MAKKQTGTKLGPKLAYPASLAKQSNLYNNEIIHNLTQELVQHVRSFEPFDLELEFDVKKEWRFTVNDTFDLLPYAYDSACIFLLT